MGYRVKIAGIYSITIKEHIYIGCSVDITNRWNNHLKDLLSNKHHNSNLQLLFNKSTINDLHFNIIKCVNKQDYINYQLKTIKQRQRRYLLDIEDYYIKVFKDIYKSRLLNK